MYKCERENEILSILNECQYATVKYLAGRLNISPSSIRRDLKFLENKGIIKRSYGGAELANSINKAVPFSMRVHENIPAKKRIAKRAASLLHEGDVVFLDSSSSSFFLAEYLPAIKNITVITNGVEILYYLSQFDVKVYSTGGVISDENRAALVGSYAENLINNLQADYFIFSVQAVLSDGRAYDFNATEVAVRNLMLKNASKSILLCDQSKIHRKSLFYQCNVDELDYIISDLPLDDYFDRDFEHAELIFAE